MLPAARLYFDPFSVRNQITGGISNIQEKPALGRLPDPVLNDIAAKLVREFGDHNAHVRTAWRDFPELSNPDGGSDLQSVRGVMKAGLTLDGFTLSFGHLFFQAHKRDHTAISRNIRLQA